MIGSCITWKKANQEIKQSAIGAGVSGFVRFHHVRHSYLSLRGPLTGMNVLVVFVCCLAVYEFTLRLLSTFPGSSSLWSSGVSTSPSCGRLCPYHLLFRRFITESGVCTHSNPVLGVVFSDCVDRLSLCRLHFRPSVSESYHLLFRRFITESGVCTHSNPTDDLTCDCDVLDCNCSVLRCLNFHFRDPMGPVVTYV